MSGINNVPLQLIPFL